MATTTIHVTEPNTVLLLAVALIVVAVVLFVALRPAGSSSSAAPTPASASDGLAAATTPNGPSAATTPNGLAAATTPNGPSAATTGTRTYVTDPFETEHREFWKPRNLESAYIPLGHSPLYPTLPIVPVVDYPYGLGEPPWSPAPTEGPVQSRPGALLPRPRSLRPAIRPIGGTGRTLPRHDPDTTRTTRMAGHKDHAAGTSITINNTNTLKAGRVHGGNPAAPAPAARGSMVSLLKALM